MSGLRFFLGSIRLFSLREMVLLKSLVGYKVNFFQSNQEVFSMSKHYTPDQAAILMCTQKQAVYAAIRAKKLKAVKHGLRWSIDEEDLHHYCDMRYRPESKIRADGTPVYNQDIGLYSPCELAEASGKTPQNVYYLLYTKKLKYSRYGALYIVDVRDFEEVTGINTGLKR